MCACRGEPHLLALVALDAILTAKTSPPTAKGDSSRVRLVSGAEGFFGRRWAGRRAGRVVGAGLPPRGNIPGRLLRGPFPPPPAVSPPSPRFLRPVRGGVLGRLSLAPWGSGIAIRWTGTPPGSRAGTRGGPAARRVPWWATLGRAPDAAGAPG